MIIFLMVLYVIVCILLITLVLLQPTEGGGLSQTLGGGQVQTIFGTKATSFLTKTSAVLATLFLGICLILAAVSGKREKSLLESDAWLETNQTTALERMAEEEKALETENPAEAIEPAAADEPAVE